MFTGLIETIGIVTSVRHVGGGLELCVRPGCAGFGVEAGGSVAVDGVCLTVEKIDGSGGLFFTAVAETLGRATVCSVRPGRRVNLERAVPVGGRLDGHCVLGHVDATGRIMNDERAGVSVVRTISVPEELFPLTAEKGSIAVDGASLTVVKAEKGYVSISLIPATMAKTTMGEKKVGDSVNIECDVLARYLYNMIKAESPVGRKEPVIDDTLMNKMERLGF
jgi:riboflavin synthase